MSSTQSFDTDLISKLEEARETLADGFSGIVPAFESSIELAHSHNLPVLEKESTGGLEAAQALYKQYQDLSDSIDKLIEYYKGLEAAMQGQ